MKSETQNSPRIHHHRLDKDYSVIANSGVENPNLSFAAKGLLWYMISRESTFEIHTWHLAKLYKGKKRGNRRDGIQEMLNELKNEGYLTYRMYRGEKGQWEHRYDIYPIPYSDFQKKFPEQDKPELGNPELGNPAILPITESPIIDLPINNPPLSSPQKKSQLPKSPKKISLRSEEEDIATYKILDETTLPPKDKLRLSKEFTEAEVARALNIAKTQTIKKTLMSLLLNILQNPDKWPDATEAKAQTPQQQLAIEYNEKLKKQKGVAREPHLKPGSKTHETVSLEKVAQENDTMIFESNAMRIVLGGFLTTVSLRSSEFTKDIKDAIAHLR